MNKTQYAVWAGLCEEAVSGWVDDRYACVYCNRAVTMTDDGWADPEATGDDEIWRLVCDENDSFLANHEGTEVGA